MKPGVEVNNVKLMISGGSGRQNKSMYLIMADDRFKSSLNTTDHFFKWHSVFSMSLHLILLKPLFSLENKTATQPITSLESFPFGPTLSSPVQVHLKFQGQVLHKRIWVLVPKKGVSSDGQRSQLWVFPSSAHYNYLYLQWLCRGLGGSTTRRHSIYSIL